MIRVLQRGLGRRLTVKDVVGLASRIMGGILVIPDKREGRIDFINAGDAVSFEVGSLSLRPGQYRRLSLGRGQRASTPYLEGYFLEGVGANGLQHPEYKGSCRS